MASVCFIFALVRSQEGINQARLLVLPWLAIHVATREERSQAQIERAKTVSMDDPQKHKRQDIISSQPFWGI